jgi:hypothetical protein
MRKSHRSWPYKIGGLSKKGDSLSSYPLRYQIEIGKIEVAHARLGNDVG